MKTTAYENFNTTDTVLKSGILGASLCLHCLDTQRGLSLFLVGLCAGVKCKEHARCEVKDGKAQCTCKDVRECPQISAPVCGHNNQSYINRCYLDVANCLMDDDVDEKTTGKCGKSDIIHGRSVVERPGKSRSLKTETLFSSPGLTVSRSCFTAVLRASSRPCL